MRVFTEQITDTATVTAYVLSPGERMTRPEVRPCVLVIPGGGYQFVSEREGEPVALAYVAEGFNAVVLTYATGPDAPIETAFADGCAALAWVREKAATLFIDPDKVTAVGFSAGGHLAARLAVASGSAPNALVLAYPVTLPTLREVIGRALPDVVGEITSTTPPTFVWATSGDELVPVQHTTALAHALAEHGVPFESHVYLMGPHGLSLARPHTAAGDVTYVEDGVATWLPASVRFLTRIFGPFDTRGEPNTVATRGRRAYPNGLPT
ncbi:MAG: alpha/beta hydrolase [Dermatophilus congolensis]|nr:alpha/beta hydrolase [Dermatophilus congolensis]